MGSQNFKEDIYKYKNFFIVELSLNFEFGDFSTYCGHGSSISEAFEMAKTQYVKGNKFNQNTLFSSYTDYIDLEIFIYIIH